MSITDKFGSAVGKLGKSPKASSDRIQAAGKAVVNLPGQGTSRIRTVCGKTGYAENYSSTGKAGKCCYGKYFCAG